MCIAGGSGYTSMVDVLTTWLQSTLHTFQRIPRPLPPYLPTRGGYGLIKGACRGVAGKPAAAARTRDATHSSSATHYSYLSTAPSPGPSPRDMGIQEPAGVYAATGGWAHRWPSSPHPPPIWAPREKARNAPARGELEVGTGSGSPGRRRPRSPRFPCHSAARPRSARAIAERADYKSRLQALVSYW